MKFLIILVSYIVLNVFGCSKQKYKSAFNVFNNSSKSVTILTKDNSVYTHVPNDGERRGLDQIIYVESLRSSGILVPRLAHIAPLKVVFDDKDTVWHFNTDTSFTGGKYINKSSPRSLFNPDSYKFESIKNGERGVYTFTEADYEFAKE